MTRAPKGFLFGKVEIKEGCRPGEITGQSRNWKRTRAEEDRKRSSISRTSTFWWQWSFCLLSTSSICRRATSLTTAPAKVRSAQRLTGLKNHYIQPRGQTRGPQSQGTTLTSNLNPAGAQTGSGHLQLWWLFYSIKRTRQSGIKSQLLPPVFKNRRRKMIQWVFPPVITTHPVSPTFTINND